MCPADPVVTFALRCREREITHAFYDLGVALTLHRGAAWRGAACGGGRPCDRRSALLPDTREGPLLVPQLLLQRDHRLDDPVMRFRKFVANQVVVQDMHLGVATLRGSPGLVEVEHTCPERRGERARVAPAAHPYLLHHREALHPKAAVPA